MKQKDVKLKKQNMMFVNLLLNVKINIYVITIYS